MNILLCGLPGVGKTTCGQQAAQMLDWSFIDLDKRLENLYHENTGETKSCRKIFQQDGEAIFREWERLALATLKTENPCIVALGGGILEHPGNHKLIKNFGFVIYLQAEAENVWPRVETTLRAFINPDNAKGSFLALAECRHDQYVDVCNAIIDVNGLETEEIVEKIIETAKVYHG